MGTLNMNRERVQSSNVFSIRYDLETKTLEVEFNNKSIYHYFEVPESRFEALMSSSSKGGYLNQSIKRKYPFSRIK